MAFNGYFLLGMLLLPLLLFAVTFADAVAVSPLLDATASLNRSSFPPGFIFGAGSSAYQ
ncbi:hypothetical protein SESBI_30020, partial [Sesbania bispinosa]